MTLSEIVGLVSIGMSEYNGERYTLQALDSLLAQDYEIFEFLKIDSTTDENKYKSNFKGAHEYYEKYQK